MISILNYDRCRNTIIESDTKFYVVGGPVQPGRNCYLQRNADAELFDRLEDGQYCHVLAQHQTGKTSLLASTAARLRKRGTGVAVVDLTQASGEEVSENTGRWYYSIAYRIVRDLRIKADVQAWWKDRGGLTNLQRLREFFLEVVLAETDTPVVICLDRVEATVGQPLAQDLFSAVRSCYDARATQVDFQRLCFVLSGSASPGEIVKDVQGSIFEISRAISLPDFSPQEMSGLIAGLGTMTGDAEALVGRVWAWTRGHPYLSQKVFRGLARRADSGLGAEDVDDLVRNQFLAPNALREEPHLVSVAQQLLREGPGKARRLNLYGRIRKGIEVMAGTDMVAESELAVAGVIAEKPAGELGVRNEIYAMVFDARWVNQNLSFGFKGFATGAILLLALLAIPLWYSEYLPRPYVQALATTSDDYPAAIAAHDSLKNIPGYAATADRLLADFLAAKSSRTLDFAQTLQPLARLRQLPGGVERSDELIADYWERRAQALTHTGDRDAALISLLESLQQDTPERRRKLGELIGKDYGNLLAAQKSNAPLQSLVVTDPAGAIGWLDQKNNVQLWQLRDTQLIRLASLQLQAEEQPGLVLRAMVTRSGSRPRLTIRTNHPRPEQVVVNMQAPSGQRAQLSLRRARQTGADSYRFEFETFTRLKKMQGAEMVGNWTIAISDIETGVSGDLLAWSLDFAEARRPVDSVLVRQPIPEPRLSENALTRLAGNGSRALAWPADPATRGPIVVWDIASKAIVSRISRLDGMLDARLIAAGERIVTIEPRRLMVWNAATGKRIGAISVDEVAELPLSFSANGRYVATRKRQSNDAVGIVVWDLLTLRPAGATINIGSSGRVVVDDQGQLLAVAGRDSWARVWSVPSGKLLYELEHISPPRELAFDPTGQWLATDDRSNTFRLWRLDGSPAPVTERLGNSPWFFDFAGDSSGVLIGSHDRAYELVNFPAGDSAGFFLWHSLRNESVATQSGPATATGPLLLSAINLAVTTDGAQDIKLWSLPEASGATAQRQKTLPGGTRAAISTDGKRIAIGERGGGIKLHTVGAPGSLALNVDIDADADEVKPSKAVVLEFSGDQTLLASAAMDGSVRIWDTATGQRKEYVIEHTDGAVHDILFASADTLVISASPREVLLTRTDTGEVTGRLRIQANHPQLAMAAETNTLFIADDLDGVTAWRWEAGQVERIADADFAVRKVAVTQDGRLLVTAGVDRALRLWDVSTRSALPGAMQMAGKVDDMWIAADGKHVVVHAGHWLHSVALYSTGLDMLNTRLLATAPAAVRPARDGTAAHLLLAAPGRPVVLKQPLDQPLTEEVAGDPGKLRAYWRSRLGLTVSADGVIQAL